MTPPELESGEQPAAMAIAIAEDPTRTAAATDSNILGSTALRSVMTQVWPARPAENRDFGLVTV